MFGIAPGFMRPGITLREIAEHRVAIGQYPGTDPAEIHRRLARQSGQAAVVEKLCANSKTAVSIPFRHEPTPGDGWVVTYEDVTEGQRIEGAMLDTRQSLAAAKTEAERAMRKAQTAYAWLCDVFEAIPTGLVLFDAQDRFVLWNKRFTEQDSPVKGRDALRRCAARQPRQGDRSPSNRPRGRMAEAAACSP